MGPLVSRRRCKCPRSSSRITDPAGPAKRSTPCFATRAPPAFPIAAPTFYSQFPSWFQTIFDSGISAAALVAVLLNILFNVGRGAPKEVALAAEAPTPGVTPQYDVPGGREPAGQHISEESTADQHAAVGSEHDMPRHREQRAVD